MKKVITGAVVLVAALAGARRFGPAIRERAMTKCHQMMSTWQEMSSQHAGSPAGMACTDSGARGSAQAQAGEHEPAEAAAAS